LSPLVVLLSVVVWGWLLGPVGALLSALLTVVVKLVMSSTKDLREIALWLGPLPAEPPSDDGDGPVGVVVPPTGQVHPDPPEQDS
jgi:AI-2 transport protein TqsA